MTIDPQLRAALPGNILPRDRDKWINWHRNINQDIRGYFDIKNVSDSSSIKSYNKTVASIQHLLGEASKRNEQLRPFGGTWSFSDVAVSPGWMIDTSYLGLMFRVSEKYRGGAYANGDHEIFLVQAGTKISEINRNLETGFGRSLNSTGASNGQTIAGAIATGTHGSAIDHGGVQNHVIGMHLIAGPDRHVWVERKSDPATKSDPANKDSFAGLIGAELKRDDDLFNAALVGLGGMGFVAGVMIRTVPLFQLSANREWLPYDAKLKHVLETLDFSDFSLPGQKNNEQPYFFLAVINPFELKKASVTAMYKRDYDGHAIDYSVEEKLNPGYELLGVMGTLTDALGGSIDDVVNAAFKQKLKKKEDEVGTLGETFSYSAPQKNTLGAALGVKLGDVPKVLDLLIDEQTSGEPAPLIFACRYVRPSGGTLEFTRHDPTCVIDIDGVQSDRSNDFLDRARTRLKKEKIAHTQHWGKILELDAASVRETYGDAAIENWIAQRRGLLDRKMRHVLSSRLLEQLNLAS